VALACALVLAACAPAPLSIESQARLVLTATHAKGLAVALVESSRVSQVAAVGIRNAKGDQLEPSTVMYGASLTKAVFAYVVMRLVDAGKLDLDKPLASYLDRPLPAYDPYVSLADDSRWQQITARHALTHSTGLANFAFLEPDHKLHIHFDPGSRYAYSGEGIAAAIRAGEGPASGCGCADRSRIRPAAHDTDIVCLASRLCGQSCRRLERSR
jgi:CubicO group peptidase (beta-lactamase class C family)